MTDRVTKKVQGQAIFDEELINRAKGMYDTNRAFRAVTMTRMVSEVNVSTASASAMFNQGKLLAEASDPTIGLGRDPKKVTVTVATPTIVFVSEIEDPEMEAEDEVFA